MANKKINDLTAAASFSDTMQLETDLGGVTSNKVTGAQMFARFMAKLAAGEYTGQINNTNVSGAKATATGAAASRTLAQHFLDAVSLDDFYDPAQPTNHDLAISNAITALTGTGRSIKMMGGTTRNITAGFTLPAGMYFFGGAAVYDILNMSGSAFNMITLNNGINRAGVCNVGFTGFDKATPASKFIRIGDNVGATASTFGNYTVDIINNRFGDGAYDFIISETECDCSRIADNVSFSPHQRAFFYHNIVDTRANAPAAGLVIEQNHMNARYSQPGECTYGIFLAGTDGVTVRNNIINGHDYNIYIEDGGTSITQNAAGVYEGNHIEDFRIWVRDLPAWAANTVYNVGTQRRPITYNGYTYEVTAATGAKQSGSSAPAWPTTLYATVTDGDLTWKCQGRESRRWASGQTYAVGGLVKATSANSRAWIFEATAITTGVTGGSEPAWPTTNGGTVVDGGVTWTAKYRSLGARVQSNFASAVSTFRNSLWFSLLGMFENNGVGKIVADGMRLTTDTNLPTDMVYCYGGGAASGSAFIANNCPSLTGNIIPWRTASTDSFQSQVVLNYSRTVSETKLNMNSDGLGYYVNNGIKRVYSQDSNGIISYAGRVRSHPGYASGSINPPSVNSSFVTGTTVVVSDKLYAFPFEVIERRAPQRLYIRTATANTGSGSSVKGGIYTMDPITKQPATLIKESNSGQGSTGNDQLVTLTFTSCPELEPGWYYFATLHTFSTTAAKFVIFGSQPAQAGILGYNTAASGLGGGGAIAGYDSGATSVPYASAFPTTFPTPTAITSLSILPAGLWD